MQFTSYIGVLFLFMTTSASAQDYVPGEMIVKFKDSAQGKSGFSSKATSLGVNLKKSWGVLNLNHFQSKPGQNFESLLQQMKNDPNVEYAEPNYILTKQSTGIEGSPLSKADVQSMTEQQKTVYAKSGVSILSGGGTYYQTDAPIQMEEAWTAMRASSPQTPVVAVIDTGVDYTHEVFTSTGAIWSNSDEVASNGIDDDGNGYIDDIRGWNFVSNSNNPMDDENHGTHVAGIILGATQDIFATTLTAAKVKIMPLKFLDSNGSGATSDAIEAIYYAINNGATIINASWGGGGYSQSLMNAIVESYNAKVSFAAAAGNSSLNNDASPTYPSNYDVPNLISVAASGSTDSLASFSNYGASTVLLASPGVSILSTLPNDSYGYASGTSMATPLVAGILALMEREYGAPINGYQMSEIIAGVANANVGNIANKVSSDARVNAYNAVQYMKSNSVDSYQPDYSSYAASRGLASADSGGGGCGLVKALKSGAEGGSSDFLSRGLMLLIVLTPFAVAMVLKQRRRELENRRTHQRYKIESEVRISLGDKELVGSVSSISMGGVRIDTEALLEHGGIIEMNIMSPDGKEKLQVLGKVVWCEDRKAYGVAFSDMAQSQASTLSGWTQKLMKSS